MPGASKKQFIRRSTMPQVASTDEFEEVFASQVALHQHYPTDIPIDRIDPSPFQIRRAFDDLTELIAAMRMHGFTSRLWVRPHPTTAGRYQLVYGERRLRAARQAGLTIIPCEVTHMSDRELVEIGLTENLHRRDLDPMEEAQGFQRFMDEFGYSYRELAERIGKDKGYIENRVRLLRMPKDVQAMVTARPDTVSAARELTRLPTPEARAPLIEGLINTGLSLKATHTIVDAALDDSAHIVEVVTAHVAAHRTNPKREIGAAARGDSQVERELERDWSSMVRLIDRWQTRLPALAPEQRAQLQGHINLLLKALEALAAQLR